MRISGGRRLFRRKGKALKLFDTDDDDNGPAMLLYLNRLRSGPVEQQPKAVLGVLSGHGLHLICPILKEPF